MQFEGKVALVTGAGSGIGRAIALALASEGAMLAINDIREDAAQRVVDEIGAAGGRAMAVPTDVADGRAVLKMYTRFLTVWDTLDILVNNAGTVFLAPHVVANFEKMASEAMSGGRPSTALGATSTMEDGVWRRTLAIHLDGTFHCTREALKVMEKQGSGRVVNLSSVAGTSGLEGSPHYSAAKAGILGFTRSVAREVGPAGVTVNAIAPGYIETPMTEPLSPVVKQMWTMNTPLKKAGKPEDIAAAALYLASEDGRFVTGQVISPNGGWWMP